ncbi:MAG: SIMPL domain-containing protein [Desulforhabdus sp.]|jgi:uncharacterized protein YggE|nr:SIMPL domain-containing protein [Desulforhabdus sp.]
MTKKILSLFLVLLIYPLSILAQTHTKETASAPALTVTGYGEAFVAPDQAIIRLGVISQAKEASAAQQQSNRVASSALDKFKRMNIPVEKITTAGLTLSPVFSRQSPKGPEEALQPSIVGYRARNMLQVVIDDIGKVGEVIDAGVNAGANQMEGVSFELKEDGKYKDQALRLAVQDARRKADAIAAALGVEIEAVHEILEGGVNVIRPQMQMARAFAAEAGAPVEPGQVKVDATVTIRFCIAAGDKAHDCGKADLHKNTGDGG